MFFLPADSLRSTTLHRRSDLRRKDLKSGQGYRGSLSHVLVALLP